jgi:RimJ/RimL family protein N-acetyltransferase
VQVKIEKASASEAERLKSLRLAALKDAPYAYGAVYEVDKDKPIDFWQQALVDSNWFFTSIDGVDIGLIGVEKAAKDRGSKCWIFGWWIEQSFRGQGVAALMLSEIDKFCIENNWQRQGLGVWPENKRAITAYLKLGFTAGNKPIPSRSKPGQLYLPMYRNLSI